MAVPLLISMLALLQVFTITSQSAVYGKVGEDISLGLTTFENASTVLWGVKRPWTENRYDRIAVNGNCSYKKNFSDRVTACLTTLNLTNLQIGDAGTYRLKIKNITHNKLQIFSLQIFDLMPVLGPVRMEAYTLTVRCDDLKSPRAVINIELKDMDPHPTRPHVIFRDWGPNYLALQQNGHHDRAIHVILRCCSSLHGKRACTPWKQIWHDIQLSSSRATAQQRPWCKDRQSEAIKNFNFGVTHFGQLIESTCIVNTSWVIDRGFIDVCENKVIRILLKQEPKYMKVTYNLTGKWRKIPTGKPWTLRPQLNHTGKYSTNKKLMFNLFVHPTLRVAINIIEILDHYMILECAHTGGEMSDIKWFVHGQYSSSNVDSKQRLVFKPDCWWDRRYWYAKFGIRCTVTSGPWEGSSRWFLGEFFRISHNRVGERWPESKVERG
ncbi:putative 10.5 kDa protein [red squirrel adenovirus 1]|uniref:Putative 10.5 kDa protein n=1 Tax=red squirrel adenovirus 1 TaxID=2773314 RepID=A0A220A477_9ADEN|nr:putative 10.5 kDa protein [red squirrel adenovirus 1]ARE31896.1 putative 10.5 kDa protein [red squirrel adenovirus 1]